MNVHGYKSQIKIIYCRQIIIVDTKALIHLIVFNATVLGHSITQKYDLKLMLNIY